MGVRRRARETALQVLFQQDYAPQLSPEQLIALYSENFELPDDAREFATRLVRGTLEKAPEIQSTIEAHSSHWKTDRMAAVDKNILRLATYELKFMSEEVPPSVVINEAIEIGKKFGSLESASFINGILDNIAKGLAR